MCTVSLSLVNGVPPVDSKCYNVVFSYVYMCFLVRCIFFFLVFNFIDNAIFVLQIEQVPWLGCYLCATLFFSLILKRKPEKEYKSVIME